ncbi:tryptophan 2,3-dioxygenase [Sinosporangium siamense]|uniref:Tryptophan 2,3-dioxygenase n=1 Tax=Sinosporangium siamense TaxID=1367973 RepID=A0A919RD46_9ACTN|nr:tryptophan 2,3-dioxygenase family protein [Sinosporangium siamense]GII90560.1 tryptophan 2,3-dioxygenase [Sinosporangium siamense]
MITPVSAEERSARERINEGQPTVDFEQATPYDRYVGTETLHDLQHTVTDEPEELAFLVTTQVMELYFGLLRSEWLLVRAQLDADDVRSATSTLRRSVRHFEALNAAWAALSWMTPKQFNGFRDALGEASGFQSAMYRHVEILLGLKSRVQLRPYRRAPKIYAGLEEALSAPSLYDAVLKLLARRGFAVPAEVLERDLTEEYRPRDGVEAVWTEVYGSADLALRELAEVLMDVAVQFSDWKYHHVVAVRRSMGAKPGSGGSAGLKWLEQSMRRDIFPELWTARTFM